MNQPETENDMLQIQGFPSYCGYAGWCMYCGSPTALPEGEDGTRECHPVTCTLECDDMGGDDIGTDMEDMGGVPPSPPSMVGEEVCSS